MKVPRISLLTLMAVIVVVALDGLAFRLIASRPDFLVDRIWFGTLLTLPMVNVLAMAAAMRSTRRGASRAFLVGFEIAGWAAVVASFVWRRTVLEILDWVYVAVVPAPWMTWFDESTTGLLVAYLALFGAYFLSQCLVATLFGQITRLIFRRFAGSPEPLGNPSPSRSRIVPLAWFVVMVAIPVVAIEGYLRAKVDPPLREPNIARLDRGAEAVVDFHKITDLPAFIPLKTSPLAKLDGKRVRVDSDTAHYQVEQIMMMPGERSILRDLRDVRITLLEGDRKGEAMILPHFVLRPLP